MSMDGLTPSRLLTGSMVALVVLAVAAVGALAGPVKGARYRGHLTQTTSETVIFKVNRAGTLVTGVKVKPFIPNKCGAGGEPPPEFSKPAKIRKNKFSAVVKEKLSNGLVSGMATVTGKFLSRGRVKGVVRVPIPEAPQCSGNFAYSAKAGQKRRG
jgi:hypothetical protein